MSRGYRWPVVAVTMKMGLMRCSFAVIWYLARLACCQRIQENQIGGGLRGNINRGCPALHSTGYFGLTLAALAVAVIGPVISAAICRHPPMGIFDNCGKFLFPCRSAPKVCRGNEASAGAGVSPAQQQHPAK